MLVYGTFKRSEEAIQQLTQINLQLPESVKPQPQQFSSYASLVNDLGADEMKGGNNQLYEVRLRPAALPTIDESLLMSGVATGTANAQPKAPATNSATKLRLFVVMQKEMWLMYSNQILILISLIEYLKHESMRDSRKMPQMRAQKGINLSNNMRKNGAN